ncbi:MAG: hypothetical protein RR889_03035 [Akkermansia sp.]
MKAIWMISGITLLGWSLSSCSAMKSSQEQKAVVPSADVKKDANSSSAQPKSVQVSSSSSSSSSISPSPSPSTHSVSIPCSANRSDSSALPSTSNALDPLAPLDSQDIDATLPTAPLPGDMRGGLRSPAMPTTLPMSLDGKINPQAL